jgi:hypothetical protein
MKQAASTSINDNGLALLVSLALLLGLRLPA